MPRAQKGAARRQAKARLFRQVKGYRGARSTQWGRVKESITRAGQYAYRDRRNRKRDFRRLWITRISAALAETPLNYSRFMAGLKAASIGLNRKMLSEIAIHDEAGFKAIVDQAQAALDEASKAA